MVMILILKKNAIMVMIIILKNKPVTIR